MAFIIQYDGVQLLSGCHQLIQDIKDKYRWPYLCAYMPLREYQVKYNAPADHPDRDDDTVSKIADDLYIQYGKAKA